MALKKSELYSSLWSGCDELRGGMDASQYKDYVLSFLFIKYISDKYAEQPYAPITVPKGASFADMVGLKGKPDIGDQINKKIIAPLANANQQLSQADFPDFNDPVKLGDGKEKVDRLTNLIAIFESPALNFSKNRAEGDDILGDAYEYLMRHFATESGKSKGQFYTPAEVSRIIAQVIGIRGTATTSGTTVYDPTCGSGSLLLKVADEARTSVTIYGQEKDAATSGLARMNMILHNTPTALIMQGNTLTDPKFRDGDSIKTFDYVVANPPFSDKRWSTGLDPLNDPYERFKAFGVPPSKQGDYAYLLHIVRSLRSTGAGACILPHGVLFRGNVEADNTAPKLIATDELVEDPSIFALEEHLEEFLIENWSGTELGKNYKIFEEDGEPAGQQYPTDTGPIDILALRKDGKELLVVELKKGRASDAVVGQIQRYMGYVLDELAEPGQTVRGCIIALEDDLRLKRALRATVNIDFYRYQVSFKLFKG